ncbi:hypothetical protein JJB11_02830 [Ramlibacter ginsenosidimutans]|uniref:Uncharacterized protein n=1 Tax=Ramlibacter ginsenosidimutans TaxID=502333 RepID=A0A934TQU0_9BURK|nr:hypothetical protein [Ramlibacter ginsenosidimutans]MBK6005017.1 hypothetical protein [Ramlibacter ginsenosidimutans]
MLLDFDLRLQSSGLSRPVCPEQEGHRLKGHDRRLGTERLELQMLG